MNGHICQESPFKDTLPRVLDHWGRLHFSHESDHTAGQPLRDMGTSSPTSIPPVKPPALHLLTQPKPATKGLGPSFSLGHQYIFKNILSLIKNSDISCTYLEMPRGLTSYDRACPQAPRYRVGQRNPSGRTPCPSPCVDLWVHLAHADPWKPRWEEYQGHCAGHRERNAFQAHGDMHTYIYTQFKFSNHRHTHAKLFTE